MTGNPKTLIGNFEPQFPKTRLPGNADRRARRYPWQTSRLSFAQGNSRCKEVMRRTKLAFAMFLFSCLFSGHHSCLNAAQVNSVEASSEDTKAIEAIVHSNPSDHVTEELALPTSLALQGTDEQNS
jgi:hypothetical protein